MDITVALLSTNKSKLFKSLRLLSNSLAIILLLTFIVFLITSGKSKELAIELFYYQLMLTLPIIMLSNLYLGLSKAGIQQIGNLTFSEDGLIINHLDDLTHYQLKDLRNMKIQLNEYKGEPTISIIAIRLPKLGIENFLWVDKSNKKDKLRFELSSSKHHHQLNNRIIDWQVKYPMIEK